MMISLFCFLFASYQFINMTDFTHHPFLQRQDTMYLSTLNKSDYKQPPPYFRQSSFLQHDIAGTQPKALVSRYPHQTNFSLSTYVEPVPDRVHSLNKTSNPLFVDDIDGARPRANQFRTKRLVNPLCPKYVLPSAGQVVADDGRKFLRDTLDSKDINGDKSCQLLGKLKIPPKQQIQGSTPQLRTKYLQAKSRLQVKDINKDLIFQTSRRVNPLQPTYNWRDNQDRSLNSAYGQIGGTHPVNLNKTTPNRPKDLCLTIKDIEGTQVSSMQAKRHFIDKRRQFRNYMMTQDIDKAVASSLPKGITTKRQTNPLMPNYQYPGRTQRP